MLIVSLIIIFLFGFVILFGAPYLPTLKKEKKQAIKLLDLKKGDTFLELGSGDGRMLREMAKSGVECIGYELNPLLVLVSFIVCWKYRKIVSIKCANYWRVDWPEADGIYVFLLQKYMKKLDNKIITSRFKGRLVSYAFKIPKKEYTSKKGPLFLYVYQ